MPLPNKCICPDANTRLGNCPVHSASARPPRRRPKQDREHIAKARSEGVEGFYLHAGMGIDNDGPYVGITIRDHEEQIGISLDLDSAREFADELDAAIAEGDEREST